MINIKAAEAQKSSLFVLCPTFNPTPPIKQFEKKLTPKSFKAHNHSLHCRLPFKNV